MILLISSGDCGYARPMKAEWLKYLQTGVGWAAWLITTPLSSCNYINFFRS